MEDSGLLVESLTYIYQRYDLISKRYDEFIHHIVDFIGRQNLGIVNNIQYQILDDGGLHLIFSGNELILNYSFDLQGIQKGRILCHKKVNDEYILFSAFEYNEQGGTTIPTDNNDMVYRLNDQAHAINIMLYLLKTSFSTNQLSFE
jgi:hypothetical protein